jgi:hypothetical protein
MTREHGVRGPDGPRDLGQTTARWSRQAIEQIEAMQVGTQKRRRAFADSELDESGPVDDAGHEGRELDIPRGFNVAARAQEQQSRVRMELGAREHAGYDVVLVRLPLPILVRCALLHVPLVARQHVVVSAPKILLGSSVGFS